MSVVVDSSLAVKWCVWEPDSPAARYIRLSWDRRNIQPLAPSLCLAEITNALLQHVAVSILSPYDADAALHKLPRFLTFVEMTTNQSRRALALAHASGSRAVYDWYFVALAEELDCELWTADVRFWRTVRVLYPNVKLLGHDSV